MQQIKHWQFYAPPKFTLFPRIFRAASPCDRFAYGEAAPPCKENMLRACQTDLSATAYRWKRLVAEKRYFGRLPGNASSTSGYNDGILSSILVKEGWKVGVWWLTDSLIWFQKLFSLYLSLHSSRPWLPPGHFRLLILHRYTLMYSAAGSPGGRTLPGPPHTQPPAVHSCVIHHCRFTGWPDAAWSTTHTTPSSALLCNPPLQVHRVAGRCLVHHTHNPQQCTLV